MMACHDGVNTLTYDAEGRLATSYSPTFGVTSSYFYDAGGQRVSKIFGSYETDYVHDPGGALLATYVNGSYFGNFQDMWVNGMHFGEVVMAAGNASQTQNFSLTGWLGSQAAYTDPATGVPNAAYVSQPFGDAQTTLFGSNNDDIHFTGKERDGETGNDYFGARYYASTMGRFLSPDPIRISSAHLENPQRWNEYAYGLNNPLINVDIDGRFSTDGHKAITIAGFRRAGVNPDSHYARAILAANHAVDTGRYIGIVQAQLGPQHQSDHFLKAPEPENQIGAYNAAMSKIHGLADAAYSAIKTNGLDSAANDVGSALHTIQDSFAHTQRDSSGAIVQVDCFTCISVLGTGEHTHNDPDATNRDGSLTDPANAAANATSAFLDLMNSAGQLTQGQFEQQYQQYVNTYFRQRLPNGQQQ